MTDAFDPRIVKVGIEIQGEQLIFEDLDLRIQGQKFAGPTANMCTIKISNLTRDQRNYILTRASPYLVSSNKTQKHPIFITVDVGRKSYGTFRLFEGTAYISTVISPPDIGITLRSLTQSEYLGLMGANSHGAITDLRQIAQSVADQNNLYLEYNVKGQKQISNYAWDGSLGNKQVAKLQLISGLKCYIDNGTLVVIDLDASRTKENFVLSANSGMVGVPQATESGVIAQCLIDPGIIIGGGITIDSKINPSVNGEKYNIQQMTFEIANRDTPFFYTLLCTNTQLTTSNV